MVDHISPERRSWLMARVKGKDTTPELRVRRAAHAMGLRFRLHRKDLPGKPDLVFPKHKLAVFVHGCFWHRHDGCPKASTPKSRTEFWDMKFQANVERDKRNLSEIERLGWSCIIVWECETQNPQKLDEILLSLFDRRVKGGKG